MTNHFYSKRILLNPDDNRDQCKLDVQFNYTIQNEKQRSTRFSNKHALIFLRFTFIVTPNSVSPQKVTRFSNKKNFGIYHYLEERWLVLTQHESRCDVSSILIFPKISTHWGQWSNKLALIGPMIGMLPSCFWCMVSNASTDPKFAITLFYTDILKRSSEWHIPYASMPPISFRHPPYMTHHQNKIIKELIPHPNGKVIVSLVSATFHIISHPIMIKPASLQLHISSRNQKGWSWSYRHSYIVTDIESFIIILSCTIINVLKQMWSLIKTSKTVFN